MHPLVIPAFAGMTALELHCALKEVNDLVLRLSADDLTDWSAALEDNKRRDAHDTVLRGDSALLVDVQLTDLGALTLEFGGNFLDNRADLLAGTAPWGPEVHEDRDVGLKHFLIEIF